MINGSACIAGRGWQSPLESLYTENCMNSFEARLSAALGLKSPAPCSPVPSPHPTYLAAVSGGADSIAMLAGLVALRKEAGFSLHCVHVEHGIRPPEESREDARTVEALCEKLEVPCRVVSITPGKIAAFARSGGPGLEAAARFFRQRALRREAKCAGAEWILTAHTKDDLLENLLMRVLRGSGPAGLVPMPRVRGRLLRPLLQATRQDVLSYLEEREIPYRTDSTNADLRFLRNRVRHKLVPLLDEFFPSWRSSLLALAETQSLTAEFLNSEVRKRLPWEKAGDAKNELSLRLKEADFLNAPQILREEAVFAGADKLASLAARRSSACIPVPRRSAVRRAAGQTSALAEDLGPVRLKRQNGLIELTPALRSRGERGFSLVINEPGAYTLDGKVLGLRDNLEVIITARNCDPAQSDPLRSFGAFVVSARPGVHGAFYAAFPLIVRNHRPGDRIIKGGHKRRFSDILDGSARARYTTVITAEDAEGTAAFVCLNRGGELLVISEPSRAAQEAAGETSLFEVFGGNDA